MNEIGKLMEMLKNDGIPFKVMEDHYLPNVVIESKTGKQLCDAIIPPESDGSTLEIYGAMTVEESQDDSVLPGLKAKEVFKRFKYCYTNNTKIYK